MASFRFKTQIYCILWNSVFRMLQQRKFNTIVSCPFWKRGFITKRTKVVGKNRPTFQTLPLGLYTHSHHATITRTSYTKEV